METEAEAQEDGGRVEQSCCIGCFRLMPPRPESPPNGCDESQEPELLCASCILSLAGKSSKSLAVQTIGGVLSPLPKLSLLVKAEAKCQDQMQQLRCQQENLRQQKESLEATKRAKEEALVAEKELAKQRRKHFLMIQERRKREDELKFGQFQDTSRSEQEFREDKSKKKKKPKPPKVDAPLQRRKSKELEPTEAAVPHVEVPTSTNNDSSSVEAHSAILCERRRQVMACYSQDLSPLIDGRKPRRLPFPKAAVAMVAKRRQTLDNNAQVTTVTRNKNQRNARNQDKGLAPKTTKLRPLEEQKNYIKARPQHTGNQFDDSNTEASSKRVVASPLSLLPPRHSGPLTAEIKPVSWAYELAKDVLPQDYTSDLTVDEARSFSQLHPVAEDDEPQFTMFPLQHQLPTRTFPPSKPEPPPEATTTAPRWEYSAERLSSLLEKYNVSVSAVTKQ